MAIIASRARPAECHARGARGRCAPRARAAAIWAMSSSFGGAGSRGPAAPSASRNIVWQKGQAVPMTSAPVATSSSARSAVDALALLLAQEHLAAAGAAAEGAFARPRTGRSPGRPARLPGAARRRCRDSGPGSRGRGRPPSFRARHGRPAAWPPAGRAGAPAARCDARSRKRRRTRASPRRWCARNAGKSKPFCPPWRRAAFRYWLRPPARPPGRCPGAGPDRRCTSPCAARRRSRRRGAARAPAPARSRGPADRRPPCSPARGNTPAEPS